MTTAADVQIYESVNSNDDLSMASHLEVTGSRLLLRYELHALGQAAYFVLDGLRRVGQDGRPKYDPLLAYSAIENGTIFVLKRGVPRTPQLKQVEFAYVPWAHRLATGVSLQGEISFPVPAPERSPYYPESDSTTWKEERIQTVRFALEYAAALPEVVSTPIAEGPNLLQLRGPLRNRRLIEATFSLRVPLRALRRTDKFEPA